MAAAEPMDFRLSVTENLTSQEVRRLFFGMFRLNPTSKPCGRLAGSDYRLADFCAMK